MDMRVTSTVDQALALRRLIGQQRSIHTGGTFSDWRSVLHSIGPMFASLPKREIMAELDIGEGVFESLRSILVRMDRFDELCVMDSSLRVGYSWVRSFVAADDAARAEIVVLLMSGEYVSQHCIERINRKHTRASTSARRTRVGQGMRELSITGAKDSMSSALVVAAQTALDVVGTADDAIAGRLDGSGQMSEADARAYLTAQLQEFAERCTVTSGGRSRVRIHPKAGKAVIELRALRKEHPIRVTLTVDWGSE